MTMDATSGSKSVEDLRQDFDNTFASPLLGPGQDRESLITLRVAGEALAVKTLDIAGLAKRRRLTPLPTRVRGLLGTTALRGALLPVYDLAVILGFTASAREGSWLMITGTETPVALTFDEFEGQVNIERTCLYESDGSRDHERLSLLARIGTAHLPVIDIPGIVEEIRKTAGLLEPAKE